MPSLLPALQPSPTDARPQNAQPHKARVVRAEPPQPRPEALAMNAWTVGLAGGLLEGAPIRLAAEMARVVDDGDNLHVLPVVTRGPVENLNSLLYLRGIDAAIINSDALEEYKSQVPDIQRRITYVLNLFPSELHIFVRPEIKSLSDLAGKKVGVGLGTNYEQWLKENVPQADIRTYDDDPTKFQDLAVGRIDVILVDRLAAFEMVEKTGNRLAVAGEAFSRQESGVALRKGNPQLLAVINEAIAKLRADGTLKELSEKWFGADVTQ